MRVLEKTVVSLPILLAVVGCQSYHRQELDLDAHWRAWSERSPDAHGLAAYAGQLEALRRRPRASYDPSDGLTLREAEAVTLFFNPTLRAARLKARVAAVGAMEAGRWQDPELSIDGQRIIESVARPWVLAGTIGFTVPLWGRAGAEKNQARAEAEMAQAQVLVEEAEKLAELHERWLELAVLEQRTDLARQYLQDLEQVVRTAEQLRTRGELDAVEAKLFRIEQLRRSTELRGLELRRKELEVGVKAILGLIPQASVKLVASLPRVVEHIEAAGRREWIKQNHPRLRLAKAEYEVAERTLALEVRRQYPDLGLSGGYGTEEGEDRILGGLSVPLPVFSGNRRAIAEARAARESSRATVEAMLEELLGSLARAEIALETARQQRELIEKELSPLVDEQLRDARNLGRLGDVGTVVLLEALTRAYETRIELLEAVVREADAVNRLNALLRTGTGLEPQPARAPASR
jgi:outer membrane protein TolC